MQQKILQELCEQVQLAANEKRTLQIKGFGSKAAFFGCDADDVLDMSRYSGIINYDPSEMVVQVRSGTPVSTLINTLAENRQMLMFDPVMVNGGGSVGGMLSCGLSGSRSAFSGMIRDYVLGTGLINGRGEYLEFGGQVMKNVAGYDVSRMLVGALGKLGIVTDVSLKVLPADQSSLTVILPISLEELNQEATVWARSMSPISAISHNGTNAMIRLSGREQTLSMFVQRQVWGQYIDQTENSALYWEALQQLAHKNMALDEGSFLLLVSLPRYSDLSCLNELSSATWLMDWAGARYWVKVPKSEMGVVGAILSEVVQKGGHVRQFGGGKSHLLSVPKGLGAIGQRLRESFDPFDIFNPGLTLYA